MDSGCVQPGDEYEVLYDVSRPLLPEEVLGIMDQLLCHEVRINLLTVMNVKIKRRSCFVLVRCPGIWVTLCRRLYSRAST